LLSRKNAQKREEIARFFVLINIKALISSRNLSKCE
jgi:hypothetical protein